ncbi:MULTISPECIES: SdpI family protein [unclassified Agrococcus]|uniref:SdpI family protein n=1 Tax=unclassified Agrococcus TaxID=2615065 RepID=UPI003621C186
MEELFGRGVLAVVMTGVGASMWWMARAAASGRLGRNAVAGIRTRATLASDAAWLAAHRRAEGHMRAAAWCALTAGLAALVPMPMPAVIVVVLLGAVGMLALSLRAAAVGGQAAHEVAEAPGV